jgi:hypothetical protein
MNQVEVCTLARCLQTLFGHPWLPLSEERGCMDFVFGFYRRLAPVRSWRIAARGGRSSSFGRNAATERDRLGTPITI